MLPLPILKILLVLPPLITAAAFFAIGARVVIRGRPMVLRARLSAWLITLLAVPTIVVALSVGFSLSSPGARLVGLLPAVLLAAIVYGFWRSGLGYFAIAAKETSLRAALQAALTGLGLPFEETVLGFTLPSLPDTLQVRLQPRLAHADFRMKSRGHADVLAQIAERAREHLELHGDSDGATAALVYGLGGLLFLVLAIYPGGRF